MRYLKMLGLAAIAAVAMLAFGVGSASAAELDSTGVTVPAGTTIHATLESGTSFVWTRTDGSVFQTCTAATLKGVVNPYNGGDVTYDFDAVSTSGCSFTTDTLTNGSLRISAAGTVSGSGTVVTVNAGVTCRYGTGLGTHLGTLSTGKLKVNAVINEQEPKAFLCADTLKMHADIVITSPHDLTVT